MRNGRVLVAIGLSLLVSSIPAHAGPPGLGSTGVTLYEVSERVTFDPDSSGVILRNATSPLLGFAELGTALCPSALLVSVPKIDSCTVIATGTDSISTVTGTGPVSGTFDVVINAPGNSSVHVPDLPAVEGTFTGSIDLSLAVVYKIPLGSITGTFTITKEADPTTGVLIPLGTPIVLSFTGTFRLPFGIDDLGHMTKSDNKRAAFYLADDFRTRIPVKQTERSVGFPTVRLELTFE